MGHFLIQPLQCNFTKICVVHSNSKSEYTICHIVYDEMNKYILMTISDIFFKTDI